MLAAAFALLPDERQRRHRAAAASSASSGARTGGVSPDDPEFQPAGKAKLVAGLAIPPADAPPEVVKRDQRGQQDRRQALQVRRRPRHRRGHRATTAPAPSPTPSSAPACWARRRSTPRSFMRWGKRGQGQVDHGLHEPRPRVHDDRRPAPRHRHARQHACRARSRAAARAGPRRSARRAASPPVTPTASRAAADRVARRVRRVSSAQKLIRESTSLEPPRTWP